MKYKPFLIFSSSLVILALILLIAYYLGSILLPFLLSYVLLFILSPLVHFLQQHDIRHSTAVYIVFSAALICFIVAGIILVPAIYSEISKIQTNVSEYSRILTDKYVSLQVLTIGRSGPLNMLLSNESLKAEIFSYVQTNLLKFLQKIPNLVLNIIPLILYITFTPFVTFFFLLDEYRIKKKLISMAPNRFFETSLTILHRLPLQFGMLLRGFLVSAIIISILASVGLWIIGLEYPIIIGVFAGVTNLIPFFGPIAGTIAACLVALVTGSEPAFFLYIVFIFLLVNLIDNVFVQPIVFSKAANLHPLLIIFLVLGGSKVGGILGMAVAVPFASLLQVLISILYKELYRPGRPDFSLYTEV